MPCHHIEKQSKGERDRANKVGNNFNGDDDKGNPPRDPFRVEDGKELQTMLYQSHNRDQNENKNREGKGDGEVTRDRKAIGDHAKQIGKQDKHKKRKNEGSEGARILTCIIFNHIGDEVVTCFK